MALREVRIFSARWRGVTLPVPAGSGSADPHWPQWRCPAGLACPHTEHAARSRAPHSPQNFCSAGFSCWQEVQRRAAGVGMPQG
jgi:hypothetical protein